MYAYCVFCYEYGHHRYLHVLTHTFPSRRSSDLLRDYSEAAAALREVPSGASLQIDPARVTVGLLDNLDSGVKLVEGLNPTTLAKSRKSPDRKSTRLNSSH